MNSAHSRKAPPFSILTNLRCTLCKELLSCDPVKILPNNAVVCGRCSRANLGHLQAVRTTAFEDVANYFAFPCMHDKCNRLLDRHEVLAHEAKCEFAKSGCMLCLTRCCADNPPPARPEGIYYVPADEKTHALITCAHCYGYLSARPIYVRANGTYVCHRCGPDLQTPPVIRDRPLETLLECFLIQCSYRTYGCNVRDKFGDEMVAHETACEYNPHQQRAARHSVAPGAPGAHKVKGVISTISSGHIYATITPNHFYNQYQYRPSISEGLKRDTSNDGAGGSSSQPPPIDIASGSGDGDGDGIEGNRWQVYGGNDNMPVKGVGITRNESILYNNVVSEIKYKQHKKHAN